MIVLKTSAMVGFLAESLNADLVTVDGKFQKIPGIRCTVRNLRDR